MNANRLKIVVVGSYKWEQYAPAFYEGFKDLGCEVLEIDYEQYFFNHKGLVFKLLNKIQSRLHLGYGVYKFNRDIRKRIKEFNPDFVFLYRCYAVTKKTLIFAKKNGVKVYGYNNDDPFSGIPSKEYYRNFIKNAKLCDLNYVYRKKNIHDFKAIGVTNTRLLLPYYLKKKNYCTSTEKDISIAFVGHFEDDGRDFLIKKMIDNAIPVVVFGDIAWKKSKVYPSIKGHVYPEKRGEEYNAILNRINVSLVFLSKINKDTYTRRCFEIPITKSVMLSEYTQDMNDLFPENKCAVYFRNDEELIAKCNYLLSNPSEVERIKNNAYLRLKELGGSELDRVKEIINLHDNK